MRENSTNAYLAALPVGGRYYVETTATKYPETMRRLNPAANRRSAEIKSMRFSCTLLRAIGTRVDDIRYLVCVERLE